MSETPQTAEKYRVNPVEIVVFSVVSLLFIQSIYSLFQDSKSLMPLTMAPPLAGQQAEGNSQAHPSSSYVSVDVKCGSAASESTGAAKARLSGGFCGIPAQGNPAELVKTEITNRTNQYTASVFTDTAAAKFSTDYIPLASGGNEILIEFTYQDGRKVTQELSIHRFSSDDVGSRNVASDPIQSITPSSH